MTEILFTVKEKIAYLDFHRPEARNAISRNLLNEFSAQITELQDIHVYKKIRALVLRGSGGLAFCAGADLKERAGMSEKEVWQFLDQFRDVLFRLESLKIPTVAAITGVALGGGLEIALACDLRVCSENAILGLPEAKLGIIPGAGGTQRLPRLIGESRAKDLIYSGRRIDALAAREIGIINHVYPEKEFEKQVEHYVQEIVSSAPISLAMAKQAIQEGLNLGLEKGLDVERTCYKSTINTKDRAEALVAFRDKRKPLFIGE